ncbi:MAG: tetratricopeptide repeat protein [Melioribacteraceae bacterium]|nr:tetratricopeptide repeat protein [Melioribacteraceae bacterium]MCF8353035.1 tetratricopeptide repeat protein [Melioribacteraceae bacterium]MCF8392926.1 tetratricopeptide repeat protein [Melioribacteraceae bacterium]MCF8417779.1 tetratricopeptide repeat protein [Melioribacteraceae bacterium]
MKTVFSIIISLFLTFNANFAQRDKTDSLKILIEQHTENDTTKVNLLNEMAAQLFRNNAEEALDFSIKAKDLADELEFPKGQGDSRKNIAFYYIRIAEYNESIKHYRDALTFYEKIDNKNRISLCFNNIGIILQKQGEFEKAIESHKEALKMREKTNDIYAISSSLLNIGVLHYQKGNFPKAIEYYNKVLDINHEISDTALVCKTLNNLAVILEQQGKLQKALEYYHKNLTFYEKLMNKAGIGSSYLNIGVVHYMMKDYNNALDFYNKALAIQEEIGNKEQIANVSTNIGLIHQDQNEYYKALPYYEKALKLREEIGENPGLATSYYNFGNYYFHQNKYSEAETYYQKSLKLGIELGIKKIICENNNMLGLLYLKQGKLTESLTHSERGYKIAEEFGYIKLQKECAEVISQTMAALGRFEEAYYYHVKFKTYADSLVNESNIKEITNIQNKYDFENEKKAIAHEQQKREAILKEETRHQVFVRNAFIIGFAITLIFIVIIFYFYRKTKRVNRKLIEQNIIIQKQKEEKELLVREIHHRVKNNLQIISGLFDLQMKNTENAETKATLIDSLNRVKSVGLIHELLYQTEDVIHIDFTDFVTKLMEHITSFSSKKPINKTVEIPDGLKFDIRTSIPLGLIITELFTNSFKYAFEKVDTCEIFLSISKMDDDQFQMIISDNGIGLPDEYEFSKTKSLGLRLVRSLTSQLKGKIDYEYKDGARFIIRFSSELNHE